VVGRGGRGRRGGGYARSIERDGLFELTEFFVLPAHQAKGVGTVACLPFAPALAQEAVGAPAGTLAWVLYLGAFPTAIAFSTWAFALARMNAGRLGAVTYLAPPVSVLLGWLLLGETPVALAYLGGALCLVGVWITRRRPRPAPTRVAAAAPRSEADASPEPSAKV